MPQNNGEPPPASKIRFLRREGFSYTEIAQMYGISVPYAYALAHEAEWRSQSSDPSSAQSQHH